jgi:hypothetical protein
MKRGPGRPRKHPLPTAESTAPVDPLEEFEDLDNIASMSVKDLHALDEEIHRELPTELDDTPPGFVAALHADSRVTTLQLVAMFRRSQLEERKVGQIMAHAGVIAERGRGYPLIQAVGALIEYYKRHTETRADSTRADVDRRKKAEADTAEIKAMELRGELVPKSAAVQFWADARIEIRKVVETAGFLTPEQKAELLRGFQRLKTKLELPTE